MVALASVVFVVGIAWGYRLLTASPDTAADEIPSCRVQTVRAGHDLTSALVTVDVFNGGDQAGLAGRVSSALQERGFRQGAVANSQSAVKPTGVTILTTNQRDPRVQLVARQFTDVAYRQPDVATSSAVTVIVGDAFDGLADGAPTSIPASSDVTVCY